MGSSPLLLTHKLTILTDSDGRILLRFSDKNRIVSVHEPLNEVEDQLEEQVRLDRDSMISFNERGCNEIMFQFIKDLDSSFNFDWEEDT